jgi:hypothetical protein
MRLPTVIPSRSQGGTVSIPETSFSIEAPVGPSMILATAPGHWGELQAGVVLAGGGSIASW